MKSEKVATRLKRAMGEQGLKQVDLINKCKPICDRYNKEYNLKLKITKSDLSQWLKGIYEPSQSKLTILAEALNTTETWLMGYDVPLEHEIGTEEVQKIIVFGLTLSELLRYYNITRQELSETLKIDLSFFDGPLNNTKLPDDNDIEKIANYFGIVDKNDLFNCNVLNKLMGKYQEINTTPDDKYQFGFALEKMFEKISKKINKPLDELKKILFNETQKNVDTNLILTYDDLENFFINYFNQASINMLKNSVGEKNFINQQNRYLIATICPDEILTTPNNAINIDDYECKKTVMEIALYDFLLEKKLVIDGEELNNKQIIKIKNFLSSNIDIVNSEIEKRKNKIHFTNDNTSE